MSRALVLTYNIRRSLFEQGAKCFYSPRQFQVRPDTTLTILPIVNNLGDNV